MIVGTVQLVETLRTVMKLAPAPAPQGLGRGLARQSLAWAPRRPAYDFLAFRGEPEPAANPVEQWHTQLGFERAADITDDRAMSESLHVSNRSRAGHRMGALSVSLAPPSTDSPAAAPKMPVLCHGRSQGTSMRFRIRVGTHHAPPIRMPAARTSPPPSTTWNAARKNGVSM
jgi:hypothetical protein